MGTAMGYGIIQMQRIPRIKTLPQPPNLLLLQLTPTLQVPNNQINRHRDFLFRILMQPSQRLDFFLPLVLTTLEPQTLLPITAPRMLLPNTKHKGGMFV